jgi:hypothetical protein
MGHGEIDIRADAARPRPSEKKSKQSRISLISGKKLREIAIPSAIFLD